MHAALEGVELLCGRWRGRRTRHGTAMAGDDLGVAAVLNGDVRGDRNGDAMATVDAKQGRLMVASLAMVPAKGVDDEHQGVEAVLVTQMATRGRGQGGLAVPRGPFFSDDGACERRGARVLVDQHKAPHMLGLGGGVRHCVDAVYMELGRRR